MAKKSSPWQTITTKPLSGALDTRSNPGDVPLGTFRWKQNFFLSGPTKLQRRKGWDKLFPGSLSPAFDPEKYTNFDYHDQGTNDARLPVTLIYEATMNDGKRYLYAGTQDRVSFLDETFGTWTHVLTGMGGSPEDGLPQTRFKMAVLQNKAVFTNNVDTPRIATVGSGSAAPIADLGTLNVTAAGVIIQWNSFMFLMNLTEGGEKKTSRIRWSDINDATAWKPDAQSLADFQDLDYGDDILGAAPMSNSLYIYTSRSIWRAYVNNDPNATKPFVFIRVYNEPKNQAGCLVYPNTLVSVGNNHWYVGRDAIYRFDPYIPEPEQVDWLFAGSGTMFEGLTRIDPICCQSPVAEAHPDDKEIYISYPTVTTTGCMNSTTLVFNYKYKSADILDFGFTAFGNYRPSPGSGPVCNASQKFIGASGLDYCLKEFGDIYSRNLCTNPNEETGGVEPFDGSYTYQGYYSILRGLFPLGNFDREKEINNFLLEVHARPSECAVRLRVGMTFSESDPNDPDGTCSVIWRDLGAQALQCLDNKLASAQFATNIRRDFGLEWTMFEKGRFLYYELTIEGMDGGPANGGESVFSRMETSIRLLPA